MIQRQLCRTILPRSQSQPSTGYRHSDSVSLSDKYGERRTGYEEQSDRLEICFSYIWLLNVLQVWRNKYDKYDKYDKYGERRTGYEEQSDRLEICFSNVWLLKKPPLTQFGELWLPLSLRFFFSRGSPFKYLSQYISENIIQNISYKVRRGFNSCHISSRYETEDQSEYRTDEDEAEAGHPQTTDLDEGETEIGWKSPPSWEK